MATQSTFRVLSAVPKNLRASGVHPETERIVRQIKSTRGKVLQCRLRNARDAANRLKALHRAKASGKVSYRQARRQSNVLYIQVR